MLINPLGYLCAEQCFAELKHRPHGEGEHEEVDVPVSHGEVLLTDREHLPHLLWCPDRKMRQG